MIKKTVQRSEECFIQFTEDELLELDIKAGDKFSCSIENEAVVLTKFKPVDIDLSEFSREILEMIIADSIKQDVSVNDVISNILEQQLSKFDV